MIIQCEGCKAKFRLNEDRIKGKGVRVRCKNCGDYIIVMKPGYESLKVQFMESIAAKELNAKKGAPATDEKPADEGEPPSQEKVAEPLVSEERAEDTSEPSPAEELATREEAEEDSMVPDEAEEIPEERKDEVDLAFDQFLDSIKEESRLGEEYKEEPPVSDDDEAHGEREEPESASVEEKPEILSPGDTLAFLTRDSDEGDDQKRIESEEKIDAVRGEEEQEGARPFDISDSISQEPGRDEKISEESAEQEPLTPAPGFAVVDPLQADGPGEDKELGGAGDLAREPIPKKDLSQREEAAPYEYVPRTRQAKRKPGSALKFLSFILAILIIVAGAGAYLAFTKSGNSMLLKYTPFLRSVFGLEGEAPKTEYNISNLIGYYETNRIKGKIFIIKGEVVNLSNSVKSGIVLKGELLGKKGEVLSEKVVYAGNSLDGKTLKKGAQKSIDEFLQNKLGKNLSNIDIQPGSSVPFMIVFFDLPGEIEAYKVESLE